MQIELCHLSRLRVTDFGILSIFGHGLAISHVTYGHVQRKSRFNDKEQNVCEATMKYMGKYHDAT